MMSTGKLSVAAAVSAVGLLASAGFGQVVYVDAAAVPGGTGSSWASAFNDLQAGLAAARDNLAVTEVRVAQGVYRPGAAGDRGVSFDLVERVSLRGGYAGGASATPDKRDLRGTPTVLSGDLAGDDIAGAGRGVRTENAYHVVRAVGLQYPTVIDGVHVAGGNANGSDLSSEGRGGGLYIDQCGTNLVVSRCVVRDNDATVGGAAMVLDTQVEITQCVFAGNRATYHPGLRAEGLRLPLVPRVDHCTFAFNVGSVGSSAGASAQALMPNPDPQSEQTIVVLRMPVNACIGFGNRSAQYSDYPAQFSGFVSATNSISTETGGWVTGGSTGNLRGDPRFADAAGADGMVGTVDDDLRLLPLSPAIDTGGAVGSDFGDVDGDGSTGEPTALDVDGIDRVYGSASDMGASEGPVLTVVTSDVALTVSEGGSVPFLVRLTRDPGRVIHVVSAAAESGGAAPAMSPAVVDLDSGNWESGVAVTITWPTDAGVTDDTTSLVFSGAGLAQNRQEVRQIDSTTPPGVVYVNPQGTLPVDGASWESGYRTLEAALAVAASFPAINEVWVKSGTYHPPFPPGESDSTRRVYTVRSGLRVRGGFAGTETSPSQRNLAVNRSLVSGDNLGNDGPGMSNYSDNCEVLFYSLGATEGTEIDGFELESSKVAAVHGAAQGFVGDSLTVRNCRFALNQGKALKRRAARGVSGLYNCVFEDNGISVFESKAVDISLASDDTAEHRLEVAGCVFRRNLGTGGAAFSYDGPRLTMSDCRFEQNAGYGRAAELSVLGSVEGNPYVIVQGCTFLSNTAGALKIEALHPLNNVPVAHVTGCTFTGNTIESYGAGIFMFAGGEVAGCLFEGNHAREGGAAYGGGFRNCVFRGNTAERGGAGPNSADGCLFEENVATVVGGACSESSGLFVRCTFRGNRAPRGGAMGTTSRVDSCVFEGNVATSGNGGAVEQLHRATSSLFSGNTATGDGGAGFVIAASGCRFTGNHADGNGGAVFNSGFLASCLLTGNTAGGSGGGSYGFYTLSGCTVYGNHAAAGAGGADAGPSSSSNYDSVHRTVNCIFWANTSPANTVEQQQLNYRTSGPTRREVVYSALNAPIGVAWNSAPMVLGPYTGGMTPAQVQGVLSAPFPTPYRFGYASAGPAGGLAAMTPALAQPEKWLSVLTGTATEMPSAMIRVSTSAPAPRLYSRVEWRFSFAVDGELGDASSQGLYFGQTGMPGTTGGGPAVQTDVVCDVGDLVAPGVSFPMVAYVRNDEGFAGIRFRSTLEYFAPPVSWCIVQGLSAYSGGGGEGNSGADPLLVMIAGADGVLGTADDDGTPAPTSPAIDSGNSRMIATDQQDFDSDGDTYERLMQDLDGRPRVTDCPVENGSVGPFQGMDRGAVEVPPFQALMAPPCASDIGRAGGAFGRDGLLDNNDFIAFIDAFFLRSSVADVGSTGGLRGADGAFDNNDFIVFIDRFFAGC